MITYKGAFGASAPMTKKPFSADSAQNVLAPGCSKHAANVCASVTVPFLLGLPLHTQRAFLIPSDLIAYAHKRFKTFALDGLGIGAPKVSCIS